MAANVLGKGLGIFGISPSVVEVFFTNHEEQVQKAKFADHLATHGLSYDTEDEYNMRLGIFVEKDQKISEWNSKQDSFKLAHNHLSTLTSDEIDKMKGLAPTDFNNGVHPSQMLKSSYTYQDSINWVTAGKMNPVQNQGQCGSCWAFSSTAAIESHHAIAGNELIKLSEQQFVSCDKEPGAGGCNGGNYGPAFNYAMKNSIVLESSYPYSGTDAACDTAMAANGQVSLKNSYGWSSPSIPLVKQVLQEYGPFGIAVEATSEVFQYYSSGVLDSTACGQNLDHAILAVGWGTYNGQEYLMVRNSWGANWGVNGYVYIAMNSSNICGALSLGNFPQVSDATWTI